MSSSTGLPIEKMRWSSRFSSAFARHVRAGSHRTIAATRADTFIRQKNPDGVRKRHLVLDQDGQASRPLRNTLVGTDGQCLRIWCLRDPITVMAYILDSLSKYFSESRIRICETRSHQPLPACRQQLKTWAFFLRQNHQKRCRRQRMRTRRRKRR